MYFMCVNFEIMSQVPLVPDIQITIVMSQSPCCSTTKGAWGPAVRQSRYLRSLKTLKRMPPITFEFCVQHSLNVDTNNSMSRLMPPLGTSSGGDSPERVVIQSGEYLLLLSAYNTRCKRMDIYSCLWPKKSFLGHSPREHPDL